MSSAQQALKINALRAIQLLWSLVTLLFRGGFRLMLWALPIALFGVVVALWWRGVYHEAKRHDATAYFESVTLDVPQVVLGRSELMQREGRASAAAKHVVLSRRGTGGYWTISNASTTRRLWLEYTDGAGYFSDRAVLEAGDRIDMIAGGTPVCLDVTALDREARTLTVAVGPPCQTIASNADEEGEVVPAAEASTVPDAAGLRPQYRIDLSGGRARLTPVGQATPQLTAACVGSTGLVDWLAAPFAAQRERYNNNGETRALLIGTPAWLPTCNAVSGAVSGTVPVLALPGAATTLGALEIRYHARRGFMLAETVPSSTRIVRTRSDGNQTVQRLAQLRHRLALVHEGKPVMHEGQPVNLKAFIAGRTRYTVVRPDGAERGTPRGSIQVKVERAPHRMPQTDKPGASELGPDGSGLIVPEVGKAPGTPELWDALRPSPNTALLLGVVGVGLWGLALFRILALPQVICATLAVGCAALLVGPYRLTGEHDVVMARPILPAILGWSCAFAQMMVPGQGYNLQARLTFVAFTAMVAVGNFVLASYGFGSHEMWDMRYYDDSVTGIAIGAVVLSLLGLFSARVLMGLCHGLAPPPEGSWVAWLVPGLLVAVTALLLATWALFGTETGIANLVQPSEAIKTLSVLLLAIAVGYALRRDFGGRSTDMGVTFGLFSAVIALLGVLLVVPIIKHDQSPFIILVTTVLLAIPIICLAHQAALWAEKARSPAPGLLVVNRRPRVELRLGERLERTTSFAIGWMGRQLVRRPFELAGLILAPLAGLFVWMMIAGWTAAPEPTSKWFDRQLGTQFHTPALRGISWLELDLAASAPSVPVAFVDTGRQVMESRAAIAASSCRIAELGKVASGVLAPHLPAMLMAPVVWTESRVDGLAVQLQKGLCSATVVPVRDAQLAELARGVPAVHNDFIGTWLFVALGRDGAYLLMVSQFVLAMVMVAAAFTAVRSSRSDEDDRNACMLLGYMVIGMAIMVFVHVSISWVNSVGLLPVMGQPMTYIAAGRSHFLFFGLPAIALTLVALRISTLRAPPVYRRIPPVPARRIGPRSMMRLLQAQIIAALGQRQPYGRRPRGR